MEWFEQKEAYNRLDYQVVYDLRGDAIQASEFVALPEGLMIDSETHTATTTHFWAEGGEEGVFYVIRNRITTTAGRKYERRFVLPVGNVRREPETLDFLYASYRIRNFMRDHAQLNPLLGAREFAWEDLEDAVTDAIQDWNVTQPLSDRTLETFPVQARGLLYMRSAVYLLRIAANGQARNFLQYNDQGLGISEHDKAPMYMQLAGNLLAEYEERKAKYKAAENAESMWGGFWSDPFFSGTGYIH
jgi:hypothetical protein